MSSKFNTQKNKPRNPFLAFLCALFVPSFGQVYNGQLKKGLFFLLISLTLPLFLGISRLGVFYWGFITILILDFSFRIYVIYDATKNAIKQKEYTLKSYNKWYYYATFIVSIYAILWFYDYNSILGVKSYKIPTTSNEPTIKVGDRIVGDLQAYNHMKPNYGDIIIFQKKDSLNPWIYRIVGLPNDKLEIQNNFLIINGKKCKATFIKETKSEEYAVREYVEELPNGLVHKMYTFKKPFEGYTEKLREIIIPENNYFLMGDNRDNAMDSRYIGVITKDEIIGKVVFGYWGETNDRININFIDK